MARFINKHDLSTKMKTTLKQNKAEAALHLLRGINYSPNVQEIARRSGVDRRTVTRIYEKLQDKYGLQAVIMCSSGGTQWLEDRFLMESRAPEMLKKRGEEKWKVI